MYALRKIAHAIYREFVAVKIENFIGKVFDIFNIYAQNIDCGSTLERVPTIYDLDQKKKGTPLYTRVLLYTIMGYTCFPDV